jgi:hypothetical protein
MVLDSKVKVFEEIERKKWLDDDFEAWQSPRPRNIDSLRVHGTLTVSTSAKHW